MVFAICVICPWHFINLLSLSFYYFVTKMSIIRVRNEALTMLSSTSAYLAALEISLERPSFPASVVCELVNELACVADVTIEEAERAVQLAMVLNRKEYLLATEVWKTLNVRAE